MSAPGAINVELTTVKFDNEIKKARHSITTHTGIKVRCKCHQEKPKRSSLKEVSINAAWLKSVLKGPFISIFLDIAS